MCTRTTSVPPALGTQMSPNAFAAGNGLVPTDSVLTTLFVAGSIRESVFEPDDLEAHHRTYERRGEELPEDLTALCPTCHRWFHEWLGLARRAEADAG
jgi:hypothetical protein